MFSFRTVYKEYSKRIRADLSILSLHILIKSDKLEETFPNVKAKNISVIPQL